MRKTDFHNPCSRKIGTKQVLATRHDTAEECTQSELTFDPRNKLNAFRRLQEKFTLQKCYNAG